MRSGLHSISSELSTLLAITSCRLTGCGGGSLPRLVSRLRMLLSDICRRADTGGILDSMLGSRVTSAFMSLRSSSSWFSTVGKEGEGGKKDGQLLSADVTSPSTATFGAQNKSQSVSSLNSWTFSLQFSGGLISQQV